MKIKQYKSSYLLVLIIILMITNISAQNTNDEFKSYINNVVDSSLLWFIDYNKPEKNTIERHTVFVMKIFEFDIETKTVGVAISFIMNKSELDEVNPIGFITVDTNIVLFKSDISPELTVDYFSAHTFMENPNAFEIVYNRLCDDFRPISGILYMPSSLIIEQKDTVLNSTYYRDSNLMRDYRYFIESVDSNFIDFMDSIQKYHVKKISIDTFDSRFK